MQQDNNIVKFCVVNQDEDVLGKWLLLHNWSIFDYNCNAKRAMPHASCGSAKSTRFARSTWSSRQRSFYGRQAIIGTKRLRSSTLLCLFTKVLLSTSRTLSGNRRELCPKALTAAA